VDRVPEARSTGGRILGQLEVPAPLGARCSDGAAVNRDGCPTRRTHHTKQQICGHTGVNSGRSRAQTGVQAQNVGELNGVERMSRRAVDQEASPVRRRRSAHGSKAATFPGRPDVVACGVKDRSGSGRCDNPSRECAPGIVPARDDPGPDSPVATPSPNAECLRLRPAIPQQPTTTFHSRLELNQVVKVASQHVWCGRRRVSCSAHAMNMRGASGHPCKDISPVVVVHGDFTETHHLHIVAE